MSGVVRVANNSAELAEQFDRPTSGAQPRLMVCRECKNLIWELSNAAEGDERKPDLSGCVR